MIDHQKLTFLELWDRLGSVERRVLLLSAQRLERAQWERGKFCLETDRRNWIKEGMEEHVDGLSYACLAELDAESRAHLEVLECARRANGIALD